MKLIDLILEKAIVRILKGEKTDFVIEETASMIDKYMDERFDAHSEEVQRVFVKRILLPLAYAIMKEDKTQFLADLNEFKEDIIVNYKDKNNFAKKV